MKSGVFACVLIHLLVQKSKVVVLNKNVKNDNKINVIKIVETSAE